jgi:hypothetical protein
MRSTSSRVLVALLFSSSLALGALSEDFSSVLNGSASLNQATLDSMYKQFLKEFDSPSKHMNGNFDRKTIFEQKIRDIVSHNSNQQNSWKKGVNHFSDLTEQEFIDHFHLSAP